MPGPRLCYAARQRAEPFRASPAQKKAPLSKGDSPQCGEMSRSDRGARARRAGRVSGLGDSDGPCLIARYTRRRPGIPPPRLRSAPPFDKGGFDGPYVTARKRLFLFLFQKLYKLYTLYTKPAPSLQNLYRDCTVLWSKPAQNRGTISLLPVKH